MKIKIFIAVFRSFILSFFAYANESIVVIMNSNSKVEKVDRKELQSFYSGENNRFSNKVAVKLSKRSDDAIRDSFYKAIGYSENQAAGNIAKLQATGRGDKIVTQKPIADVKAGIEFITINADGGVVQLTKSEYNSLSAEDKKMVKVVFEQGE